MQSFKALRVSRHQISAFIIALFLFVFFFPMDAAHSDIGPITRAPVQDIRPDTPIESDEEASTNVAWFDMNQVRRGLTYDKLKIRPRYRQEFELDSNILLESGNDAKSDIIFREIPGIHVAVPVHDHYLSADYEARLNQFVRHPRENSEDQRFNFEGGLNFTDMYLNATESLSKTTERSGTTFTERVPRFENKVDVTGGYQWNRLLWEAGYANFVRNYTRSIDRGLDYHYNQFHTRTYVDVTEKTKAFIDYVLTGYEYAHDATRDGFSNQISGGFKSRLLPKTSFFSKFGYEHIGYDSSDDTNNFISEVGLHYDPFTKTGIDLGWLRSTQQATFAGSNDFTQDELFLKLAHHLTQKITAESYLAYANQDYRDPVRPGTAGNFTGERNDDLLTLDLKLLYAFTDWISGDIRYRYARRDSNASIFDYVDHLMTVGVSIQT